MKKKGTSKISESKDAIMERIKSLKEAEERVHVIQRKEDWVVKREGTLRADKIFDKQEEAIELAQSLVKNGQAKEIIIHKEDGTIDRRGRRFRK
jgi:uncharacterized protein YdaT